MVQSETEELRTYLLENYYVCEEGCLRKLNKGGGAKQGSALGSPDKDGYLQIKIKKKYYRINRLIFLMHYGYLPKIVDHIDQDKTNNRPSNLRENTVSGNAINIDKPNVNNVSGYRGVTYRAKRGKYEANFRRRYLGLFDTAEEAKKAYDDAKENATIT